MTMNVFNFNGHQFRSTMIEGAPWFVCKDACLALGLRVTSGGVSNHIKKLGDDERRVLKRYDSVTPTKRIRECLFNANEHWLTLINESGLYKLMMRSDKPEAIEFQNWVTKEVLPSIRKTGGYLLNEEARTTAHADTKEAMPLPEGFAQMFQMLFAPIVQPLVDEAKALREEVTALREADASHGAIILSMQAHLEKMASGEEPSDVWLNGDLTRDMSDGHIRNAIKWAKKNHMPYDVLTKEQARRTRLKKKVAA